MIEGLKLDFSGKELREHLKKKSNHHLERSEFYSKQADSLVAGNAEAMRYSGGDPVKALRDKAAEHKRRSEMFSLTHFYRLERLPGLEPRMPRLEAGLRQIERQLQPAIAGLGGIEANQDIAKPHSRSPCCCVAWPLGAEKRPVSGGLTAAFGLCRHAAGGAAANTSIR